MICIVFCLNSNKNIDKNNNLVNVGTMICPKIRRALVSGGSQQQQEEIVTGISDFIPSSLKSNQNINISIVGNTSQIINQILWNEFFAKSLIKEAYYCLMHNYATEGKQAMTAVFAKQDGKVYKINQIMEWRSALRQALLKGNNERSIVELQGFSNKGNIRKINIYISKYPINIDKLHLIIKTESIEMPKVSKNQFNSELGSDQFRFLLETDRINKESEHTVSHKTYKSKQSQLSNISLKAKQSLLSKENCKHYSSKTPSKSSSKKGETKKTKQKTIQTVKEHPSAYTFQPKISIPYLTPQKSGVNRQSVLAKIITSKQQQIIFLKQELQDKLYQYQIAVRQQQETHKKQVQKLTKSVKQVLDSYSISQKQAMNQNLYLKERVRILEQAVQKTNDKLETYTSQIQTYVNQVRQLQEVNQRLSSTNKKLMEQQDRARNTQISQINRMNGQISMWKEKAQDYRLKYEKIVDMMKNVVNFT